MYRNDSSDLFYAVKSWWLDGSGTSVYSLRRWSFCLCTPCLCRKNTVHLSLELFSAFAAALDVYAVYVVVGGQYTFMNALS